MKFALPQSDSVVDVGKSKKLSGHFEGGRMGPQLLVFFYENVEEAVAHAEFRLARRANPRADSKLPKFAYWWRRSRLLLMFRGFFLFGKQIVVVLRGRIQSIESSGEQKFVLLGFLRIHACRVMQGT